MQQVDLRDSPETSRCSSLSAHGDMPAVYLPPGSSGRLGQAVPEGDGAWRLTVQAQWFNGGGSGQSSGRHARMRG